MNLKKLLVAASFISTAAVGLSLATSAQADTFSVFTGYADNLRPSGFFPTTWLGDAGVLSQSAAAQSFDSGAIRIQNTGASAITISNFSVTMNGGGGPTYNFWNALTIGAGQNGIFTQTFSYNFDSSDNSFGSPPGGILPLDPGGNGIGGCSSTAAALALAGITGLCAGRQPIVSFDIGSTHFSFNDSGHILDTGNYDFVNYSPDGNESINWNLIGSAASRGGSGVPEPATWAMMLVGFGGLGSALRRRRATVTA
jgi:hypothetical protein